MADHMRTALVEDALKAARAERGSLRGAVFHSDHGSTYTSKDYVRLCTDFGVTQSMARSARQRTTRWRNRSTRP